LPPGRAWREGDIALSLFAPPGELPDRVIAAAMPEDARWLKWLSGRRIAHY